MGSLLNKFKNRVKERLRNFLRIEVEYLDVEGNRFVHKRGYLVHYLFEPACMCDPIHKIPDISEMPKDSDPVPTNPNKDFAIIEIKIQTNQGTEKKHIKQDASRIRIV